MTFEQIRVLNAVVEAGSMRGAAASVHKTTASVSTAMRTLENEIGIELFSRDGYRTRLTDAGQVFYEKSKEVLRQMVELQEVCQRLSTDEETLVRISINAVCPLDLVLRKLAPIERRYTNTQINVSTEALGGAVERLLEGGADLIVSTLAGVDESTVHYLPFTTIRILPVAHRNHPLAIQGQAGTVSRPQAKRHTQVIVTDSSRHRQKQSLDIITGGRQCVVTDFSAKKAIIQAGLGWGGLPEYLVTRELQKGVLVSLDIEGFEVRHSQQYLIRRLDRPLGVVGQKIWAALATLGGHPA